MDNILNWLQALNTCWDISLKHAERELIQISSHGWKVIGKIHIQRTGIDFAVELNTSAKLLKKLPSVKLYNQNFIQIYEGGYV